MADAEGGQAMSVGAQYAESILNSALQPGGFMTLHSGDPGASGAGQIGSQLIIAPGVFSASGASMTNVQDASLGAITAGGTATHFGLWTQTRRWIVGGRLTSSLRVTQGTILRIRRGDIVVRVS